MLSSWGWRREEPGATWESVELPHSAVSTDPDGGGHWLGRSRYRHSLQVKRVLPGERLALFFAAAMQVAEVFVDDVLCGTHVGGYLPFEVDVTRMLGDGEAHRVEVLLDHRDDPDIPPGKPHDRLDFCRFGGLWGQVELRRYPVVHITDPNAVDEVGGGGVMAFTRSADGERAVVAVAVHVANGDAFSREVEVRSWLLAPEGEIVASGVVPLSLAGASAGRARTDLTVVRPRLWSIASPTLHRLIVEVRDANSGELLDRREQRFGLRTVSFSRSRGMLLNGEPCVARGANRHQDHPWVGYALPPAAQRRDALRIKAAGLDYVRLSHYPQSPAFLDACDELGILVMNCLPGWQFIGGEVFRERCAADARAMIRRDRNHACVVLWELSLNETRMDAAFIEGMRAIAAEEVQGGNLVTCGWMEGFDVYLRSRQHGKLHTWRRDDVALVVAEYGDWEYYASNEGFDQATGRGLLDPALNSRALRGDGEARLVRQADNHAEALADVLLCGAPLSGLWVMFDYPRGYHPKRAACGMMDTFRIAKPSFHLYRSQRPPREQGEGWGGPMVHAAWRRVPGERPELRVVSNLPVVELRLDGRSLGRREVEVDPVTGFRAPIRWVLDPGAGGMLEAFGLLDGVVLARHEVPEPGEPVGLRPRVDHLGLEAKPGEPDLLFVHVEVIDEIGTLCPGASGEVTLALEGDARLAGPATMPLEAGVASFLVRLPVYGTSWRLTARMPGLPEATWTTGEPAQPLVLVR